MTLAIANRLTSHRVMPSREPAWLADRRRRATPHLLADEIRVERRKVGLRKDPRTIDLDCGERELHLQRVIGGRRSIAGEAEVPVWILGSESS